MGPDFLRDYVDVLYYQYNEAGDKLIVISFTW